MVSGHDPNPIFFNKKKPLTPHPPTSDNILLLPYPPPLPLKVDVIYVTPLTYFREKIHVRHSVFSPNAGKYWSDKLRTQTLFTQ